ncbi:uncharacterized protein A4U43_C10F8340 [Asparagus officinalis]|uniref:Sialate O-acetylesterase domain-containing protein n=1 Tax=Asparagus officinalis TaxID=4686 RepID=A0A5P1E1D0_ASPOF|nr:uncharacterized protein A4U43_C10F8340 [Asparagus officinalis]
MPRARVIRLVPCAVGGTRIEEWARGGGFTGRWWPGARRRRTGGRRGIGGRVVVSGGERHGGEGGGGGVSGEDGEVALASGEGPFVDIVRKAQIGINLPNVLCVDAKGLQLETHQHLHLTTQAQVQLGTMLAASYLKHVAYKHNSSVFSKCDITHNHVRDLGESIDIV